MLSEVQIPERSSIKLEKERDEINKQLQNARIDLEPQASFSSDYWLQRSMIAGQLETRSELNRKISLRDFQLETGGDEQAWIQTDKARELMEEAKSQALDQKLCLRQAERLQSSAETEKGTLRRVFMKFFVTSKLGLGITGTGAGKRDSRVQSNFRAALIEASNCVNPAPLEDQIWCPITSRFWPPSATTAAHIFAFHHGQDTMDAIFGKMEEPELFSPSNGLMMSSDAENLFYKGYLVIVPRIDDHTSRSDIERWNKSDPKEYKIRVIERNVNGMRKYIPVGKKEAWTTLDNRPVTFRSDIRPRARYLYYHFCMMMLRRSWLKEKPSQVLRDELGKPWWATPGRYMKESMLLAFVEEMGHEYEELLEGAFEDTTDAGKSNEVALAAANDQVKLSIRGKEGLSYGRGAEEDFDDTDDEGNEEDDDE
ncbi:MAG: hypothetical protein Q9163_004854 [Psora crenata]